MTNYDIKYIFKRVLIFFIIFVIMSFINSCEVHAETYNLDSSLVASFYRLNNSTLYDLHYNTWYGISNNILTNLRLGFTPVNPTTCENGSCSEGLQPGQYLFDFYVLTDGGVNINNCSQLSSDFQNINITTGNWVNNQITSSCVDVSTYVETGYATYLHILYSFTSNAFATEYRFYFNYGSGWLDGSSQFKVLLGNVYDFDHSIINDFKQQKFNEQQINQNQQIISGQQNIINNQNSNTQDIIDNQNDNTDKQIESQQVCETYDKNNIVIENKAINQYGITYDINGYGITDYIVIDNSIIKVITPGVSYDSNYCFYRTNKSLISCQSVSSLTVNIPQDAYYMRAVINNISNLPIFSICKNGNQVINDTMNNINDSINDDNVDGANSEVDDLLNNSAFNDTSGIQSIINAPLNFINGLSNSCSPIQLTIPYINTPLSIPCIKQELTNHVPTVVPILSTAINGFIIYRILIDIVYLIKSARNPDDDRIEVLDL